MQHYGSDVRMHNNASQKRLWLHTHKADLQKWQVVQSRQSGPCASLQ